ncbi:branched-chain amino acid ABC transporter permease [Bordetella bronchiseptica]|uniref:Branched-chain amino acid ABC transporter, permease protein n=2 Tax=Bordetella bronchiseptica TaxID=518 RepID=A0ABR4R8H5_BORBO|nr:branched-chain amino acid ABC transporter permease [Bordetella bronchiseptica]KCV29253.1 branched-chain amino acid ABC transporter, permease protein [Bordetella bronchiseptica 00-P-2730]SHS61768.1 ABC-type branched-chain amino acid transport system, permease protein I [Mycobacteroides abscessus subsp. abscessus]AUL14726.1 branched-chain amino acid ABC transporter permease [Bordetella bronchiseptica]AWP57821.1 branched-chain amino acid ABC transporter permease [Bordetella bronchiseptica]AWP7
MDTVLFANAIINGVIVGLLLALPALAITLVFGIARFPNAAAGDYMTFGAYATVAAQAFMGASLVGSAIVATLATGLLSLFFYFWVFRKLAQRSLVARLIASIGIAFAVRAAITFFAGHGQYTIQAPLQRAWNFGGIRILPLDVYILLAALLALAFMFGLLYLSPTGRRMRAVSDNPQLAAVGGIGVRKVMVILWGIVGVFSGLGGVLLGIKATVLPELGWELLLPMFAAVILGGVGSPVGAVLGMIVFGIAQEVATLYIGSAYKIVIAFLVLLVVLLFRPQGIMGRVQAVR